MAKIRTVHIGLGPVGQKTVRYALERDGIEVVGAVDTDPAKAGMDLGRLCGLRRDLGVAVHDSLSGVARGAKPHVAVLTTVSDMERIAPQIEGVLAQGLPVVSTCEELSYPWEASPRLARRLDRAAKAAGVAVLGTGVNPGFLMDLLPICLTAVCQKITRVTVTRVQDASFRRGPFQRKIGAGLTLAEFRRRRDEGTLRHVGLTESMHMIAARMGWVLERTEDAVRPVVAKKRIRTKSMTISKGRAAGVQQVGRGFRSGRAVIRLVFRAAVGEPDPADTVEIRGEPNLTSTIPGGVNGDVATCAIAVNALPRVLEAAPGLRTMTDIPVASWFSTPSR